MDDCDAKFIWGSILEIGVKESESSRERKISSRKDKGRFVRICVYMSVYRNSNVYTYFPPFQPCTNSFPRSHAQNSHLHPPPSLLEHPVNG